MYEATETNPGSQSIRTPANALRLTSISKQADSSRQIPRCHRRTASQTPPSYTASLYIHMKARNFIKQKAHL